MANYSVTTNHRRGMNHGGMPHGAILEKLEETDLDGYGYSGDVEMLYDQHVRDEIVDWSPDTPFLEQDQTRRNGSFSRSKLNERFSGGRGATDYRGPSHPDLFVGFTGNDPRGASNDPRFDKLRKHTETRFRNMEIRMGKNVGHGDLEAADRPWGGAAFSYSQKELHRRLKHYAKWFSTSKVQRPAGRGTVFNPVRAGRDRRGVIADGEDGFRGAGRLLPRQGRLRRVAGAVRRGGRRRVLRRRRGRPRHPA